MRPNMAALCETVDGGLVLLIGRSAAAGFKALPIGSRNRLCRHRFSYNACVGEATTWKQADMLWSQFSGQRERGVELRLGLEARICQLECRWRDKDGPADECGFGLLQIATPQYSDLPALERHFSLSTTSPGSTRRLIVLYEQSDTEHNFFPLLVVHPV